MTPRIRKLNLRTETIRTLSAHDLRLVAGGMSSERAGMCSTWDPNGDLGCLPSNNDFCASVGEYCPL